METQNKNGRTRPAYKGISLIAVMLLLVSCNLPTQEEIRAQNEIYDQATCAGLGFEANSDAYKLCLLLQDTSRNIERLERKQRLIQLRLEHDRYYRRFIDDARICNKKLHSC